MEVVSLNDEEDYGFILVDRSTGLPCIGAYENKFSDSYMRKKLHAISKFYDHVSERVTGPYDLDDLLIQKNIDGLEAQLRSFLGALQNQSKQTQINTSRTLNRENK